MHKLMIVSRQQAVYEALLAEQPIAGLTLTQQPKEATILLADPPKIAPLLDEFPALEWIQSTFAGIDALTQPSLRRDYTLSNIRGCFGQLISEYVLGLAIAYQRHFATYQTQQQARHWHPKPYNTLAGKTMVILGTGSIGSHLARSAKALGFRLVGVNRSGTANEPAFDTILPLAELNSALEQADLVVSTLPATANTNDILNATSLSHCRKALLFNVGRGNALCETGLLSALDRGAIAHAFLDVFKQEPLPQSHPFWQHPAITITPHIAAESFPHQVMAIFRDNAQRWLNHQPLRYTVDFQRGY
ncbi:D-2-hydroxyacid dehydrogenase [Photobacterium gaetbulicola]|uniref:Putative D-isomer specific 2-hydroxyacid dehydrogenase family protein n=1 Tax=Photobacterium gaetbulicola Gung47 TaxID=658445 RepID=A0A0C5WIE4_9GAMM|nr:D-2-hydroxyacid dehydrogenase [Photobacterium gaetbulicola]AJR06898.1 putative D-isomer specific 2-hydroxyacid dehydrogenase family protein [Photobacterium gaetbulicola Gung47]PSU00788.1 D-2-hydroxyacid dehydrogenase [Photobacterium gaetbulicola]